MTSEEKQFALDLLKALDIGMGDTLKSDEEYKNDLFLQTKKDALRTVRYLMEKGYKNINNQTQGEQK